MTTGPAVTGNVSSQDPLQTLVRTGYVQREGPRVPRSPRRRCVQLNVGCYALLPPSAPIPQTRAEAVELTRGTVITDLLPGNWEVVATFHPELPRALRVIVRGVPVYLVLPEALDLAAMRTWQDLVLAGAVRHDSRPAAVIVATLDADRGDTPADLAAFTRAARMLREGLGQGRHAYLPGAMPG